MIQGDGEKHEIWLKGDLVSLESSTNIPYGDTIHYLKIVEREKDDARDQLMPCQKALENIGKENKSMTVKIKKQPREITLEEYELERELNGLECKCGGK